MSWVYLFIAGILEAGWAIGLKYTDGYTRLWPSLAVSLGVAGSLFFLALAVRTIPIGTGYAIWVSIGMIAAVIAGPLLFGQVLRPAQLFFLCLLLISIVGLKLTS